MSDETIISLQETIAHQQAEIDRLSDELYAQQKEISAMHAQLSLLIDRVKATIDNGNEPEMGREPPPPHY